jgi:hypothetical protein
MLIREYEVEEGKHAAMVEPHGGISGRRRPYNFTADTEADYKHWSFPYR